MPTNVVARVGAKISDTWQALFVGLPGFAGGEKVPNHIVGSYRAGKAVVVGDDLSGGHHEVVANRRMRVGVILSRQAVLARETVQVWHRTIANNTRVIRVLFHYNENVAECGKLRDG